MRVSGLNSSDDWRFGKGKADYITNSKAIRQNVLTRIRSFTSDWFLDTDANIDWITILGQKNNRDLILQEIERVTLATEGVMQITKLEILSNANRYAIISLRFLTVFDEEIILETGIEV